MSKALVTGASSGIGEAVANLLAQKGWEVMRSGRSAERLEGKEAIVCDLADRVQRQKLVRWIEREEPELVVNAGGFGLYGPATDHPIDEQVDLLEVNVVALYELTHAAARALLKGGKTGTILNVSSALAFVPEYSGVATYASSKLCAKSLSENLDWELRKQGVRVLVSCPGMVGTRFQERAAKGPIGKRPLKQMSAEQAAQVIVKQIEKGKGVQVFDWRYRLLCRIAKLIPSRWLRHVKSSVKSTVSAEST